MKVIAKTQFYGNERMWREGDIKEVSESRAQELLKAGLVSEVEDKSGETEAATVAEVYQPFKAENREIKPLKTRKKIEKK